MKKKASKASKPASSPAPAAKAKSAKPAKPAKPTKPTKPVKAAPAKAKKAAPPRKAAKPSKAKPAPKPKASPAKPAKAKPVKAAPKAATPAKPKAKPAPTSVPTLEPRGKEQDLEVTLAPEHIAKTIPESVTPEDEGALRNVMASLTSIFGGRDFLSDAELDAFLDDKIANGEIPPSAALDPLDEAQSLIYEAWNSEVPQKIRLAQRALDLSPDCADAFVILAEHDAKDTKQSLDYYRKGMEAGQRVVAPDLFQKGAGKFWEIMETRPYMRSRFGVAECLWDLGKKEEALGHLRDLMRLNPADNQGVRYVLAQVLLETGEEGELHDLLQRFRKDSAPQIRYSHALLAFRHEGRGAQADGLLAEALKANPHVPAFLLKRRKPPSEAPESADPGSEEEAAAYAMGALDSWQKTLGAADWLAERTR